MAGFRLLDGIHGEPTDRIGHTGMIDLRHDENPPEMKCLVGDTYRADGPDTRVVAKGKSGLDSTCVPRVQGDETRQKGEKLLCGA
jgi:hypothetical protein